MHQHGDQLTLAVLLAALYVVERRACAFFASADAVQSGPGGRHVAKVVG